ncbi:hypothetical protein Tco_1305600 [Tanacetum coccineum]
MYSHFVNQKLLFSLFSIILLLTLLLRVLDSEIGSGPPFLATGYDSAKTSVSQSSIEGCTSRSIANSTTDSINTEFEETEVIA